MTNNLIFYTQLISIVVFLISLFSIYRLLVDQKDSVIQLLKERITEKEERILALESQTSDALTTALSARVEITLKEIKRLKDDGDQHKDQLDKKENELQALLHRLDSLSSLIKDSDLVCSKCGEPLNHRSIYPIYGHMDGREIEADGEYIEYSCGRTIRDGKEMTPCNH